MGVKRKLKLVSDHLDLKNKENLVYIPKSIKNQKSDFSSRKKESFKKVGKEEQNVFVPYKDLEFLNNRAFNKKEFEEEINKKVEEKVLNIRKASEDKGYQLGFKAGESEAFKLHSKKIKSSLDSLKSLIQSIQEREKQFVSRNEEQILKITFEVAKRMALKEISENREVILKVIEEVFEYLNSNSKVEIHVSQKDMEFINGLKGEKWGEVQLGDLRKVDFVSSLEVKPGGCVIEISGAQVDASLETRFEEIWQNLSKTLKADKKEVQ